MISKLEKARINKELKGLLAEYRQSYEAIRQQSETKYKTSLRPGATFQPKRDGFYYEEDKRAFSAVCDRLREKAHELIDKAALEIMAQNTAAPSTEAVNVVTLLNARKNVSAEEIDQLMLKYGTDCPMVYEALHEKAVSLGYYDFKPHPIAEEAQNMEAMTGVIDKTFNGLTAEGNIAVTAAAFNVTADAAFPAEE